jgi:hypothetical protein
MEPSTSCGTTIFSHGTTSFGGGHHQRASTLGEVWMRCEERLDLASAGHTEAADVDPPTPAARHSKREIGQCPDAGRPLGNDDPRCEPAIDAITDQWDSLAVFATFALLYEFA